MRILISSDNHREFNWSRHPLPPLPHPDSYDVVVLAGDIGIDTQGMEWAIETFPASKPVVYTSGNHEFYTKIYSAVQQRLTDLASVTPNIHYRDPGVVVLNGYKFIVANMWSDLKLAGYADLDPIVVQRLISDFRVIYAEEMIKFNAYHMLEIHRQHKKFITDELEKEHPKDKTVVVTHFVPTQMAIAPQYIGSHLNPYFTNDCDDIMKAYQPELWIAGHTHTPADFTHPQAGTRIVLNPCGYPGENARPFEWKIVTI